MMSRRFGEIVGFGNKNKLRQWKHRWLCWPWRRSDEVIHADSSECVLRRHRVSFGGFRNNCWHRCFDGFLIATSPWANGKCFMRWVRKWSVFMSGIKRDGEIVRRLLRNLEALHVNYEVPTSDTCPNPTRSLTRQFNSHPEAIQIFNVSCFSGDREKRAVGHTMRTVRRAKGDCQICVQCELLFD